jgi:hypothetical protein
MQTQAVGRNVAELKCVDRTVIMFARFGRDLLHHGHRFDGEFAVRALFGKHHRIRSVRDSEENVGDLRARWERWPPSVAIMLQ